MRAFAYVAAELAAIIGAIVLFGWMTGITRLITWTGLITMKTNAALCLLLSGLGLLLLIPENIGRSRRWAGRVFGIIAMTLCMLTLSEHIIGWNLGIDELLANQNEPFAVAAMISPNRMRPVTAVCFSLFGIALILLSLNGKRTYIVPWIGAAICMIVMLPLMGYLYGVRQLYGFARYSGISFATAIALWMLGAALVCSRPRIGFFSIFAADDAGGSIVRRFFLPAILLPILLGYLHLEGQRLGLYDTPTGAAMLIFFFIVTFLGLLLLNGRSMSEAANIQKQDQLKIQESEERFRLLADNAQAIIGVVQGEKLIYSNPYLARLSGYSPEELLEMDFVKLLHKDYRQIIFERTKKRQAGEPVESHYEFIMLTKTGQEIWLDFSPVRISLQGKPAIVGIAFDITDRKKTEEFLKISEERLRLATEASEIGHWDWDLISGSLVANKKYKALFALAEDAEISYDIFIDIIHPDDRTHIEEMLRKTINEHRDFNAEFRVVWPDQTVKWLLGKGRAFYDSLGRPARMSGTTMDVTEQVENRQRLERLTGQLDSKNKELESIIGIVSHDLRSPLINIKGFIAYVRKYFENAKQLLSGVQIPDNVRKQLNPIFDKDIPEAANFIETSTEAMNNLIKTLVDVARAGLAAIKPEILDMNEIFAKVMQSINFKFKESNASYDIDANLPSCFGDRTQITQIFTNLLDNAVKYADPNRQAQICVGANVELNHLVYWVSDNGIGISAQEQEKIFEIYYQLHEKAAGGLGMGLTTVKRMVDRNNGKIWVISEKGKGSTFYVALPITPD